MKEFRVELSLDEYDFERIIHALIIMEATLISRLYEFQGKTTERTLEERSLNHLRVILQKSFKLQRGRWLNDGDT